SIGTSRYWPAAGSAADASSASVTITRRFIMVPFLLLLRRRQTCIQLIEQLTGLRRQRAARMLQNEPLREDLGLRQSLGLAGQCTGECEHCTGRLLRPRQLVDDLAPRLLRQCGQVRALGRARREVEQRRALARGERARLVQQ